MEKEEELKQLMKEVDELENGCIGDVVRIENGYMDNEERATVIKRHKEKEIKKLDLETDVDQGKEEVRVMKNERKDLEEEVKLIKEYIEKNIEEDEQEKRKRTEIDDDSNDDDDRKLKDKNW